MQGAGRGGCCNNKCGCICSVDIRELISRVCRMRTRFIRRFDIGGEVSVPIPYTSLVASFHVSCPSLALTFGPFLSTNWYMYCSLATVCLQRLVSGSARVIGVILSLVLSHGPSPAFQFMIRSSNARSRTGPLQTLHSLAQSMYVLLRCTPLTHQWFAWVELVYEVVQLVVQTIALTAYAKNGHGLLGLTVFATVLWLNTMALVLLTDTRVQKGRCGNRGSSSPRSPTFLDMDSQGGPGTERASSAGAASAMAATAVVVVSVAPDVCVGAQPTRQAAAPTTLASKIRSGKRRRRASTGMDLQSAVPTVSSHEPTGPHQRSPSTDRKHQRAVSVDPVTGMRQRGLVRSRVYWYVLLDLYAEFFFGSFALISTLTEAGAAADNSMLGTIGRRNDTHAAPPLVLATMARTSATLSIAGDAFAAIDTFEVFVYQLLAQVRSTFLCITTYKYSITHIRCT